MDGFVKIGKELLDHIYSTSDEDLSWHIVDRVNWKRCSDLSDYEYEYDSSLQDCESPIEQLLSMAIYKIGLRHMKMFNPDIDVVEVIKQSKIYGTNYRVDFFIPVWYEKANRVKAFAVECDGHEFHEKTKEQVIKGNERDRELQALGIMVLHFSGSEIVKNANRCAGKILEIIRDYKTDAM